MNDAPALQSPAKITGPSMLVVACPAGTVAVVETALEPQQADFDRYVLSPETVSAVGMAAESDAAFMAIVQERRLRESATRFRQLYPALVRWRDAVLKSPRRHSPQDVAAAYEAIAVECTWAGDLG
jgi:hypothetical protein